ncbi:hypothetical protein S4054249_11245 [Pseudoalteromonas luteoviolacea]|uniref:Uncharacterized protein n=1 Tax=Pseudoalteromonas luteoviolacea S4054 TaxID=1129367 RepID=A0A0F6ADV1_9GAMM|nr:hypothetical protein S4054249_11245 [Pseudoalteromonas luteoviolacea]AOT13301.1 hypothetical protein S40542_11220 [Pseudoalteromonas luteoviolacea]AOT18214.1 hypothetical protein S4054_11220 [Pseudoalteromonas luteoviolacea]KKE84333.1 hypothetical protein N479_10570 [Pseudoalteromonas luteoviolacea S4054]KZN76062.1 hypothetical protein N481_06845 [Pseudoalteromonas luteoviolacea S4047-1]
MLCLVLQLIMHGFHVITQGMERIGVFLYQVTIKLTCMQESASMKAAPQALLDTKLFIFVHK